MSVKFFESIFALLNPGGKSAGKINCYHCGDKSTPRRTVYVRFDGETRAVCCNGCAAILKTVEELGMIDDYLAHKTGTSQPHD